MNTQTQQIPMFSETVIVNENDRIEISNDGADIIQTNFKKSSYNKLGFFLISQNGAAFRLICPTSQLSQVREMQTANKIIISHGIHKQFRCPMIEILFEDDSESPLALWLSPAQFSTYLPLEKFLNPIIFSVWTVEGTPEKVLELDCWIRKVPSIPWLKPLT